MTLDIESLPAAEVARIPPREWVAALLPDQGGWTVEDFLFITNRTNRRMELVDGSLEVLDSPSRTHEKVIDFHKDELKRHVIGGKLGDVIGSGYSVKTSEGRYRTADAVVILREHFQWMKDSMADCADLVVEVPSQDRKRDLVDKRAEYAAAGIREYHIDDLEQRTITVLTLKDGVYIEHGVFRDGEQATSPLLSGWVMDVTACLDAGRLA